MKNIEKRLKELEERLKSIEGSIGGLEAQQSVQTDSILSVYKRLQITKDEEIQELREDLQELWDRVVDIEEHMEGGELEEAGK